MVLEDLLVLVLVSERLVNAFCDGLTVEDKAFCDRRLWIQTNISVKLETYFNT